MSNPANGAISPRFAGTVRKDSQNVEKVNLSRSSNRFNLNQSVLMSARFGEVVPFFSERYVTGDRADLRNHIDVWSPILNSPLLQKLTMYKDYFYVPYKCLLPNSWDSFKSVPVQGDDVPDDVYLDFPLEHWCSLVLSLLNRSITGSSDSYVLEKTFLPLLIVRYLLSSGGLLSLLKINMNTIIKVQDDLVDPNSGLFPSFDFAVFDSVFKSTHKMSDASCPSKLEVDIHLTSDPQFSQRIVIASQVGNVVVGNVPTLAWNIPGVRAVFEFMVQHFGDFYFTNVSGISNGKYVYEWLGYLHDDFHDKVLAYYDPNGLSWLTGRSVYSPSTPTYANSEMLDISELYAYHAVGSQFYVNDDVDAVFDFQSYMDNFKSIIVDMVGSAGDTYDYNGSLRDYDLFSSHYAIKVLNYALSRSKLDSADMDYLLYLGNLVIPFYSLRYGDYLTGSRLSPLAVGADTNAVAPVVGNEVIAVDITKSLAWQSFLNDIMKLGPVQWIQQAGIYGETPSTLSPMPRFISRETQYVGQSDTTNTSTSQGEITSRFRSNDQQFAYSLDISEDCIVLGFISYDMPRFYVNMTSRFAFTHSRYDFFQPYFQNIGDQAIYSSELNLAEGNTSDEMYDAFSWTLRDTQYKQRYSVAVGAFGSNDYLPSWAFLTDSRMEKHLSPTFVRNSNGVFDRFFKSLTNVSLSGYYHFYMRVDNLSNAVRNMQYRPGIQVPMFHQ